MGRSMDDVPNLSRDQKWENYVQKWEWDDTGNYQLARFFGDVWVEYVHTIEFKKAGGSKRYPEYCHGWDVDNCKFYDDREERCPCCALNIKGAHRYFMNAIDIEVAEAKPANPKAGWTPIRLVSMSQTLFQRLRELKPVNKNVLITDRDAGAVVQIKYNKNAEPANMYSATMDTKSTPITEEQKTYMVTQKYPDGTAKLVRGVNGLPAQFEYIRCVNSRETMVTSLKRNGLYGDKESYSSSSHSFDNSSSALSREETVAKLDAEASIETLTLDDEIANAFSYDKKEDTASKKAAPTKTKEPYDECPTEFGNFANTIDCFTKCGVAEECRKATTNNAMAATTVTPKKKEVAPVVEDDDDIV